MLSERGEGIVSWKNFEDLEFLKLDFYFRRVLMGYFLS